MAKIEDLYDRAYLETQPPDSVEVILAEALHNNGEATSEFLFEIIIKSLLKISERMDRLENPISK